MFSNKVISLDIGSYSTKIVVGKFQNKVVYIEKAFSFETPSGTYEDGIILDTDSIKNVIDNYIKKEKVKVKNMVCTVGSTSLITRELILPFVKAKELDSMIKFEIEQQIPIEFDKYAVEYRVLKEFTEEDVKKLRVLVAVLPRDISEKYYNLVKDLKLKPVSLDIHSNAVSKLFDNEIKVNSENYSLGKTVVLIDLGHSYINVIIIEKGLLKFNRMIPLGGKDINMNIAKSYNLSLEKADIEKKEHGSIEFSNGTLSHPTVINEIFLSNIDAWIREIQRIFQYYTSRNMGNRVDQVYIYGGSSRIKGLVNYMEDRLGIPTFKLEELSAVKFSKDCSEIDIDQYLNCIAAIIRR
ncbi:type IV pilus assembly protein PilM [Caminicella sporogenes DSM 14501]|uniref:Type IV pilus assembly protein PilM n=1 Tax=Caminicella sporogenes DSM 14501 TaxID=1121266 RepID=A0A1M6LNU1_9FIRM|nr:type IV pilus assembly protein PilM [Caminicella sporogenes]RKD27897.1 hypothetical protein BET04_02215 [Caminicella sporogenes]SHJ72858.1 type IV pilus assembly protein PilM [Caminicella sporogenes DSM 14501]